jgi:hypothetical protein
MKWIYDYENAPKAYIDEELKMRIGPRGSQNLLTHLQYTPSERNQGSCGNCWAWAGTGVMGINLDVNKDFLDRLSVQYINSCDGTGSNYACCGGWLSDVSSFYTSNPQAIPWSNTNASYADGSRTCADGSSLVSCGSISTSPDYPIASIQETTITTHGVGQATAIANIKNILGQNKAIWFAFYLADGTDWSAFSSFWNTQGETALWDPDPYCGLSVASGILKAKLRYGILIPIAVIPGRIKAAVTPYCVWAIIMMMLTRIIITGSCSIVGAQPEEAGPTGFSG